MNNFKNNGVLLTSSGTVTVGMFFSIIFSSAYGNSFLKTSSSQIGERRVGKECQY